MKDILSRPIIRGKLGMVSTGHHLSSFVGAQVLNKGGNAIDATIAATATLCVVKPHMCGIGGDSFTLLYNKKSGKINALNASGLSPQRTDIKEILKEKTNRLLEDDIRSTTTPGIVDSWIELSEKYGTIPLKELLEPAIKYAKNGFAVSNNLNEAIVKSSNKISNYKETIKTFIPNGRPLKAGQILIQKELGETLEKISQGGREVFYKGEISELIEEYHNDNGGWLKQDDFNRYKSEWMDPIKTEYREVEVYEQPPVSQGFLLLEALNIIEGYELEKHEVDSPENIHLCSQAMKLSLSDRIKYFADPNMVDVPIKELLSKEKAVKMRNKIDKGELNDLLNPKELIGDYNTTYSTIVDKEGNGVSFILSLFTGFGTGITIPKTGIILNNRMIGFSLKDKHPNKLEAKKRPVHTLNSYMLLKNNELYLTGGSPGADLQTQVNLQVITNVIDHKLDLQSSIELPRWSVFPGTLPRDEENQYELRLDSRFSKNTIRGLKEKGHNVKEIGPWECGAVSAIMVDNENGTLLGGADPRREGYAIGF